MYDGLTKLAERAMVDNATRSSLHKLLGYDESARIPESVFQSILKAKNGEKVHGVKVTDKLKADVQKALAGRATGPRFGRGRLLGNRFRR